MKKKWTFRFRFENWNLMRTVALIAGIFMSTSILLSIFFHPAFLYFSLFVSLMLVFFTITGICPMATILDKCGIDCKNIKK